MPARWSLLVLCATACGVSAVVDENLPDDQHATEQALVSVGFDPGMKKACARSPQLPDGGLLLRINDNNECGTSQSAWLLGNHAELSNHPATSCTSGGLSTSYPWVRGFAGNPRLGYWIHGAPGAAKTWEFKTDSVNNPPPCNDPNGFHWVTIMQNVGVPGVTTPDFNDPDASSRMELWYNDWVPSGRSRLMVGAEFCYSKERAPDAGPNPEVCRLIEVNLVRTNWLDNVTTGPFSRQVDHFTTGHTGLGQYLQLDGSQFGCVSGRCVDCAMSPTSSACTTAGNRLTVSKNAAFKSVFVNWNAFLGWAISTGYFDRIDYARPTHINSINMATETSGSAIAHVQVRGFLMQQ